MENVKTEQIIRTVLSPSRLSELSGFASAYASLHTQVISKDTRSAYTSLEGYERYSRSTTLYYKIVLGTRLEEFIKDNTEDLMSDRFEKISSYYTGIFYHEFFHVLYTNFAYVYDTLENVNSTNAHNFMMNILNICEDFYIENLGQHYFPDSERFIEIINDKDLLKEINDKFTKIINEKEASHKLYEAITWLLINNPAEFSKSEIYLKHKKFFDISRQKVLLTFDSAQRARRQILYANELLKLLNDENYQPNENFDKNDISKELKDARYNKDDDVELDDKTMEEIMDALGELARSKLEELKQQSKNPMKQENGEQMVDENDSSDGKEKEEEKDEEIDKQDEKLKQILDKQPIDLTEVPVNTSPSTEDGFFLARMSNYESENVLKVNMRESDSLSYLDYIDENCNYINQIQNIINRIRLISQGEVMHNQRYGKFDRKSACKQYPTITPFKRNIAPKMLPDLVFHLIVDGSGSMRGRKEQEAINALLLFSTALERLGIPFAIEYFNDTYYNVERVIVKEYNDKVQYKKRLAYIYENDGWCSNGNIDEINILHASQDLKARKEKDKFMIVISDGATCGSERDLHNLIVDLDKQGLNPIGIGLGDDTVCGIYPTSIYLKDNDFTGLIEFLKGCLLKPFYGSLMKR